MHIISGEGHILSLGHIWESLWWNM